MIASATQDGRTVIAVIFNSDDRFGDAQKLMKYGFSSLQPLENVYVMRTAPAGQTLTEAAEMKKKAAALAVQQKYGTDDDTVPAKIAKSA